MYLLLLDESGSMRHPDNDSGKTKWQNVIVAAKKFAN
jgi:hypothetical protein